MEGVVVEGENTEREMDVKGWKRRKGHKCLLLRTNLNIQLTD